MFSLHGLEILVKFSALSKVIALGLTTQASATDVIWCHGCTIAQEQIAVAADPSAVGTTIYVGDTTSNTVMAYLVKIDVNKSTRLPTREKHVISATPDAKIASEVSLGLAFYNEAPVGWNKRVAFGYNGSDTNISGWIVANTGQTQANFNTWLSSTDVGERGISAMGRRLNSTLHYVDSSELPTQSVTVTFDDGSKITAVYSKTDNMLEVNPDTAFDAEGNPIPYLGADGEIHCLSATRRFADDYQGTLDYNNFVQQLKTLRVPLVTSNGPPPPGSVNQTVCMQDA
jgi:hypothetical protein